MLFFAYSVIGIYSIVVCTLSMLFSKNKKKCESIKKVCANVENKKKRNSEGKAIDGLKSIHFDLNHLEGLGVAPSVSRFQFNSHFTVETCVCLATFCYAGSNFRFKDMNQWVIQLFKMTNYAN